MAASPETPLSSRRRNPLVRVLDTIGSIWFGVGLLALIFIYSSLGSAFPPIRQGALADWTRLEFLRFEKSEMEWFSWWPFAAMMGLFCLAITLVTLRRIRLTVVNAGVWAIHSGIVILCIASVVYFGTKVEGDVAVFQSRALIMAPGMTHAASMVVRPQASIDVGGGGQHQYRISVAQMIPSYELQSGPDKGKRTQAIWFNVQSSEPRTFTRVVLVGYPEFTEDVITGQGGAQRAKKVTGEALLDKDLQIKLDYDPVVYFYHAHQPPVGNTAAIYARLSPRDEWTQLRYKGLPHYYERLTHRGELWPQVGEDWPRNRLLDLAPRDRVGGRLPETVDVRITDYLPYAELQSRWVNTASFPNPMLRFRLGATETSEKFELFAADPSRSRMEFPNLQFRVEFVWAETREDRERMTKAPSPRLVVRVPSASVEHTIPIDKLSGSNGVQVPGSDYTVSLEPLTPHSTTPADNLLVRVKKGEASFVRQVAAGEKTGGRDVDEQRRPLAENADAGLQIEYLEPMPYRLLFVAGPDEDGVDVVYSRTDGLFVHEKGKVGEGVSIMGQSPLVIEQLLTRAARETRPTIVPRSLRQPQQSVGKNASLIRVEVNDGSMMQSVWLPFNQYAFDDAQRAQPSRFPYNPRQVRLADGRVLELMYSRWRDPLPSPVALDRFILQTYPGGDRPSDYISLVRFFENNAWSPLLEVKSNRPAQHGSLWYFQSQWDPGSEAYTVLGVGNRNGVYAMLAGVCLSIAGMIYAFYVKPSIIRRRKLAALAAAEQRRIEPGDLEGAMQDEEVSHA